MPVVAPGRACYDSEGVGRLVRRLASAFPSFEYIAASASGLLCLAYVFGFSDVDLIFVANQFFLQRAFHFLEFVNLQSFAG